MPTFVLIAVLQAFAVFFRGAAASVIDDKARLIDDLFYDYDNKVRPVDNSYHAVNITLGLALNSIEDLDEKRQILTIRAVLYQSWYDNHLEWIPGNYGNVHVISVNARKLWIPDIFLYNNAQGHYGEGRMRTSIAIHSNGRVVSDYPAVLKSSCEIAVKKYPFDIQSCQLKFGSWSYPQDKINLILKNDVVDMRDYVPNGEWEVTDAQATKGWRQSGCCGPLFDDIRFTLGLKRMSLYHAMYYVIPCIIIGLMTTLVFWLPTSINERMTVGLTLLIALSFFFLLVADNLPAVSDEIPIVAMYYVATTALSAVAYFLTCTVLRCHYHNPLDGGVPRWMQVYVLERLARVVFLYEEPGYSMQDYIDEDEDNQALEAPTVSDEEGQSNSLEMDTTTISDDTGDVKLSEARDGEERHANRVIMDSVKQKIVLEWRQSKWERAAEILNRFFSMIFTLAFFIATLVFLLQAFTG